VYFNTYAASSVTGSFEGENDLFSVSEDDEIVRGNVEAGVSNLLDAELYPIEARTGGGLTDVGQIDLRERSTTALRTWTAPRSRYGDLDTGADFREGIDEEWVTQDSDIAVGDTVVYEIEASGLEGALDARGEDTVTDEFFEFANGSEDSPAAQFTVAQQDPGPNRDPLLLDFDSSNAEVVADSANDTYYVVAQTGADDLEGVRDEDNDGAIDPDEDETGSVDADDSLRATFTVFGEDENDLDLTADGEDEIVETTHSLTEPEFEMTEPFNVTEVSGQEIFGEATVAPGTEVNVRVRSADGVRPAFLKTATTTVDADGQFLVTLSFNDTSPGDSYTINVDDIGPAPELSVDGTVQPVIETATTDTPAETTTTATSTTTSTPTTTTTSTPPETTTSFPTVGTRTTTPGFGVLASLVALAGAALLALRRE
jgi:PGF-CTERM protein